MLNQSATAARWNPSGEPPTARTLRDRLMALRSGLSAAHQVLDQIDAAFAPSPSKSAADAPGVEGPLGVESLVTDCQVRLDTLLKRLDGVAQTL
jgi:hypothetical protein